MTTPGSLVNFLKTFHILGLFCKSLVASCKMTFPETDIGYFTTLKKLWQIIDGVYFLPQAAVCKVKKDQAK